jgi:hypothetical protein
MAVLFWGISIFTVSFVVHFLVWRLRLPKRQTKTLLQIFLGIFAASLILIWISSNVAPLSSKYVINDFSEYLHISLFYISLVLAYMITYSGIEVDSPSMVLILKVAEAGKEGIEWRTLIEAMNDDLMIKPRITDLITDKMAYIDGDKYKLTTKGFLMLNVILLYRKMLNAGKGG